MSSELLNPNDTIRAVLCHLKRDNHYLLLLKAGGRFGGGFWNAPGGKIEPDETAEAAAIREVKEETGLSVRKLAKAGSLEFYFGHGKVKPDWTCEVFTSTEFSGELKESSEGRLEWFSEGNIPLDQMWEDDRYWMPLLTSGQRFHGVFEFSSDSTKLVAHKVEKL